MVKNLPLVHLGRKPIGKAELKQVLIPWAERWAFPLLHIQAHLLRRTEKEATPADPGFRLGERDALPDCIGLPESQTGTDGPKALRHSRPAERDPLFVEQMDPHVVAPPPDPLFLGTWTSILIGTRLLVERDSCEGFLSTLLVKLRLKHLRFPSFRRFYCR